MMEFGCLYTDAMNAHLAETEASWVSDLDSEWKKHRRAAREWLQIAESFKATVS